MKKLLIPCVLIVVLTGCVAVRLKPGASVEVTTTKSPPVINNVVTNPITIPNSFVASLDTKSQKALVDAILATGEKQIGPAQILLTNANPIIVSPTISNYVSLSDPMFLKLPEKTEKSLQVLAEDAAKDKWFKRETFASTVLGGLLAALGGGAVFALQAWHQRKQEKKNRIFQLFNERYEETFFVGEHRLSSWLSVKKPKIQDLTVYERSERQRYTDIMRLLHFFGRVAVAVQKEEIDKNFAQKMFAESVEFWLALLFRELVKVSNPVAHKFLHERIALIEAELIPKPIATP